MSPLRSADRRIRRPAERDDVFRLLVNEGPFETLRDAVLFAAALGRARKHAFPFSQTGEPIRWETMIGRPGSESLLNMLAVTEDGAGEVVDRALVMGEDRFEERARIFEEYASGGLDILDAEFRRSPESPSAVVLKLILASLENEPDDDAPQLDKLVDELGF